MTVNPYESPKVRTETSLSDSSFSDDDRVLRYSVEFDDIMEFQKFHFAHSPTMRIHRYGQMGFWAMVTAIYCVVSLPEFSFSYRLATAAVLGALTAMGVWALLKWSIASQMRQLSREGCSDGIVGDHELRIDEKGLTEITSVNESRHAFSGIVRIEDTRDHAFIYISAIQAYVIPKNRVASGDVVGFVERLQRLAPNAIRGTMR
jgi:hypothetical protein